jgi:tRNA (guanine-N7-)-methyltransferase
MVTDWEEYGDWALYELSNTPGLKNAYTGFAPKQTWRPETKFEKKGIAKNHCVKELYFEKRQDNSTGRFNYQISKIIL